MYNRTMKSFKLLCFLNLFYFCLCEQKLLIDQLRWDFLEIEKEIWNFSSNGLLDKAEADVEAYLAEKFYGFDQKLTEIPQDLLYGVEPLRTIPNFLFFYSELKTIENTYKKFREYLKLQGTKSDHRVAMEDIVYDITNNKTGIIKTMDLVYSLAYEDADSIGNGIIKMLTDNYWCKNTEQSPQQLLYNFNHIVALNDLKSYIMQQFAFIVNVLWSSETDNEPSLRAREAYERRVQHTISSLRYMVANQAQDIWKCDPKYFIKGKTYDEFTRLLQGHIQNEVDMSSSRTCTKTCDAYSFSKSYGCYDSQSEFCRKVEKCNGDIVGCFFVDSYASICVSASPSRRYDYIQYNSGTYGKYGSCSNRRTVNSWTRWFVRCHYCMCLCDQQGPLSDRYINLRPVMADVENNRVVTGMRMVKHNRILHLQIQEGKLLPYGYINQSTVHWAKLDNYKITDPEVQNRQDFFMMTYGERSMALDAIEVHDDNHVITGVRFELLDGKVHFEIHVSPFNWTTGVVDYKNGYYIYESNPYGRSKIKISSPDIPIRTTSPSEMLFDGSNTYVEFSHTDFKKDAAQTTIPFIDTQEVINKPAVPLVGAGIYYKGNSGYGGFIAPRIKTYNYARHADASMPEAGNRRKSGEELMVELN